MNLDVIALHIALLGRRCSVRRGVLRVESTACPCGRVVVDIPETDADPDVVALAVLASVYEAEAEVSVGDA